MYNDVQYNLGDTIMVGSESVGLSPEILNRIPSKNIVKIPMIPQNRSINLSNAVAIVAYETWRQANFIGDDQITSTKHFS